MKMERLFLALLALTFSVDDLHAQDGRRRRMRKETPPAAGLVERARPGRIVGVVVDATTGETLAGATVRIGDKGTVADYEGKFEFDAQPPGTYALNLEMLSYKPLTLSDVTVKAGKTTEVRAALVEDVKTLETVVVEGQMRKSSDAALVAVQKNAVQISDGYSGDMVLKQTPNFQFNTVLRRMPGVALVEDRYLSIRGLFERYNIFTLNGAPVPVNDFERNGFDYSYLPSNLISSLRIIKTASPDIINEFGGGYVQMETADIPSEDRLEAFVQGEYHPLTTFKKMNLSPTDARPFLWAEAKGLPANFPSPSALGRSPGPSTPENRAAARHLVENHMLTTLSSPTTAAPGSNIGVSWQKRFQLAEQPAGFTLYVGQLTQNRNIPFWQQAASSQREIGGKPALIDSFGTDFFRREANLTAMANAGVRIGARGKAALKNVFLRQADNAYLPLDGIAGDYRYWYYIYRIRSTNFYSVQGEWEHALFSLSSGNAVLRFNPFYSYMENRDPVMSGFNYYFDPSRQNPIFDASHESEYFALWTARQTHHLGGANAQIDVPWAIRKGMFSVGAMIYRNVHDYHSRNIAYTFPANENGEIFFPDEEKIRYQAGRNYFSQLLESGDLVIFDRTRPTQNYRSRRTLWAPFVQASYRPTPNLFLHGGLRIETYRARITADPLDSTVFDFVRQTLTDLLPSLNAAYSLNAKTNIRLAYSRTIVRPRDREWAPFQYLDLISTIKTEGDSTLGITHVHNVDLRYEFYPRKADLLSATLFYKFFRNPPEHAMVGGYNLVMDDPVVVYRANSMNNAAVAGLEFEFRQSLEAYVKNRWLSGLGIYGNLSVMASRVNPQDAFDLFGKGRGLQGQANFLLNLGLTYSEEKSGLSAAVFYNRAGRRIAWVGISDTLYPSIVEMPRDIIDVQISKTFFEKLTIRLAVQDLLGQRFRLIQFYDGGKTFDEKRDILVRNERRAPSFFLTVSYRFM
ncbi:MAG: TonB-dependent receptor [Bacteroidia bacterium]|nr:TonB-dependent receptor [Bacteroidia bacterium]